MKRSRLFLWIFGILMQAFLISMHFYQRNMEAMYAETEYLLKEVLNEELHRKQQELNLFYISKVTIDTIPLTIYNPQIEMFARFKMKSSFHKTKRII